MSLKERADRDRSTLVEKNQHQRVTGDEGVTSRLRAANSMTASTCSRSRPSKHSIISSMLAPAVRFSKMTETGMRVPLSTHAPLTFPGMLSTAGHCDQSSAAMEGFSFRSFYTKSQFVRSRTEKPKRRNTDPFRGQRRAAPENRLAGRAVLHRAQGMRRRKPPLVR